MAFSPEFHALLDTAPRANNHLQGGDCGYAWRIGNAAEGIEILRHGWLPIGTIGWDCRPHWARFVSGELRERPFKTMDEAFAYFSGEKRKAKKNEAQNEGLP